MVGAMLEVLFPRRTSWLLLWLLLTGLTGSLRFGL